MDATLSSRDQIRTGVRAILWFVLALLAGMVAAGFIVAVPVEKAIADGDQVYFEGIKGSPGEGDEFLANYVGGGREINDNHKNISELSGLGFQKDYFSMLETHSKTIPDRVQETDVSSLDLKVEYERLMKADPQFAASEAAQTSKRSEGEVNALDGLLAWLGDSTPKQKALVGIVARGLISGTVSLKPTNSQMDKLILHYRNRYLSGERPTR